MSRFKLGDAEIGENAPCFVIAEAGVNHNGSLDLAFKLVDAAVAAKANAVKFQTFVADELLISSAEKAEYQKVNTGNDKNQYQLIKGLELSFDSFAKLKKYCEKQGILFLSTPFDAKSAAFLNGIGMQGFKIPSGEITNLQLLRLIARFNKPMIISTGMAYLSEVETAVNVVREEGNQNLCILHCVSNYPASPQDVNLRALDTMRAAFNVPVGYSDHTLGDEISLAAVARGAAVIEKHFTLDRTMSGPDHAASLEPHELKKMMQSIRSIESALGNGIKEPALSEKNTSEVARKSIVSLANIKAGMTIDETMLGIKRPGTGLAPEQLPYLLGRKARVDIAKDNLVTLDMFE